MISKVTLETKELREIIALFFRIKPSDVEPNRYSYNIKNMTPAEMCEIIEQRRKEAKIEDSDWTV